MIHMTHAQQGQLVAYPYPYPYPGASALQSWPLDAESADVIAAKGWAPAGGQKGASWGGQKGDK